ncbi:hypothetical protein HC891_14975 [Candidatus Gracilibacteria bacterium]|nr:hypothetical protein [Candidatus Gracilibacteria bacterium]
MTPENCPPDVGVCSGHPALQDVRVRQAIAHATDKQQLIEVVLLGLGRPGLSLVTPAQGEGFASQLTDYAYDVAQANAILDEAGYADSDNDGVREMPGDPSTALSFRYSSLQTRARTGYVSTNCSRRCGSRRGSRSNGHRSNRMRGPRSAAPPSISILSTGAGARALIRPHCFI